MCKISRENLLKLLTIAFEEGQCSYQDLKENFVIGLVEKAIKDKDVLTSAVEKAKPPVKSKLTENPFTPQTFTVTNGTVNYGLPPIGNSWIFDGLIQNLYDSQKPENAGGAGGASN